MFVIGVFLALAATQASPPPAHSVLVRTRQTMPVAGATGAISIDGALDDDAWRNATRIAIDYEWEPGDNVKPRVATECLITFDTRRLYVAFIARDPEPGKIRAHLADRDVAFQDDTVGFFLDPFNDERRGFQFRVNPLGVQMDATNSDVDGDEDWSWDAIWDSAGRITEEGYVVEAALAFSSLRFPRMSEPQTWGFIAFRDWPRSVRHRMRSVPTDRKKSCLVCQFDKISGLAGMKPGRNLEVTPTLTAGRTDRRAAFSRGAFQSGEFDPDPGVSVRWSATPNMALNAAINPDFSQVEADVGQLDINTRFALFFPERRPFFQEGADLFSTPINAVFTRTVADPSWGGKVTGKEGRHAFGVFAARDTITNVLIPDYLGSSSDTLEDDSTNAVFRYRADIGKNSNLGALVTMRDGDVYSNRVGGIDGTIRIGKSDSVRFHALQSTTRYPDALADAYDQPRGEFLGTAAYASYQRETRDWFWEVEGGRADPDFRADSGFESRVGMRFGEGGIFRNLWAKKKTWYTRLGFGAFIDYAEDVAGERSERGIDLNVEYSGPRQSSLFYSVSPNREFFEGRSYNNLRHNFGGQVRPSGAWSIRLNGTAGGAIDFANARGARIRRVTPRVEFNLGRHLSGSVSDSYQRLVVDEGTLFTAHLIELRALYHFNARTFVRLILQNTRIDRDPALYRSTVEAETRRLFTQALFSYKLNAQTVALVGYSDNARGNERFDLGRTDRTFFIKLGYAWLP
jgi:hypothetical protein